MFKWYYQRETDLLPGDFLSIVEDGVPVGGLGASYRTLQVDSTSHLIAVASNLWVSPHKRGRGLARQLYADMRVLTASRGAVFLTGMNRESNRSHTITSPIAERSLTSFYLTCKPRLASDKSACNIEASEVTDPNLLSELADKALNSKKTNVALHYSAEQWTDQFLRRPVPSTVLRLGDEFALVFLDTLSKSCVVTYLSHCTEIAAVAPSIDALVNWSSAMDYRTVIYSVSKLFAETCISLGFDCTLGIMPLIPLDTKCGIDSVALIRELAERPWLFQDGDKM